MQRRKRKIKMVVCLAVFLLLSGCARKESIPLEEPKQEMRDMDSTDEEKETVLTVYVCGHVAVPSVYELPEGSRVCDAVAAAGGMTEDAACDYLNLAEKIEDGIRIYVPGAEEVQDPSGGIGAQDGKINLNTATKEELMTLDGIGESKAQSILRYREEHGRFQSVEEIMNVAGIKEGVFQKIKDNVVVR